MNIGNVLQDAFGGMGDIVGHSTDATVEIPLGIFTGLGGSDGNRDVLLDLTEEAVRGKLFEAMGVESGGESTNGS
jgi:nanoRNase/pAp phosphatase (c-di-AMP/oligoRNAs hydrolase)